MKGADGFNKVIKEFLDLRAKYDQLFAERYANPKKNINDCITYIINEVHKTGCNGFEDDEIYSLAIHYYDEDDITVGSPLECQVVINRAVEFSPEELAEMRDKAKQKVVDEAYRDMKKGPKKAKTTNEITQASLF